MWYTSTLAEHCGVDRTTIHERVKRFPYAFSDFAKPGKGKERRFTARDVAVMEYIDELYSNGKTTDDIDLELHGAIDDDVFASSNAYPTGDYLSDVEPNEATRAMARVLVDKAQVEAELAAITQLGGIERIVQLEKRNSELETELRLIKRTLWFKLFGGKE